MSAVHQFSNNPAMSDGTHDGIEHCSPEGFTCQVCTSCLKHGTFFAELNHPFSRGIGIHNRQAREWVLRVHESSDRQKSTTAWIWLSWLCYSSITRNFVHGILTKYVANLFTSRDEETST
jgi:hypothetical protein